MCTCDPVDASYTTKIVPFSDGSGYAAVFFLRTGGRELSTVLSASEAEIMADVLVAQGTVQAEVLDEGQVTLYIPESAARNEMACGLRIAAALLRNPHAIEVALERARLEPIQ